LNLRATEKNDEEFVLFIGPRLESGTFQLRNKYGTRSTVAVIICTTNTRFRDTIICVLSLSHYQECYILECDDVFVGRILYQNFGGNFASIFSIYLKTGTL
jgi:hypothetical protein